MEVNVCRLRVVRGINNLVCKNSPSEFADGEFYHKQSEQLRKRIEKIGKTATSFSLLPTNNLTHALNSFIFVYMYIVHKDTSNKKYDYEEGIL